MPQLKSALGRLNHSDPAAGSGIVTRLRRQDFALGEGVKVLAIDSAPVGFTVQAVVRKQKPKRNFVASEGKFVEEVVSVDREVYFLVDLASGLVSTGGPQRDFAVLTEMLKVAGAGRDTEIHALMIDMSGWVEALLKRYETSQLGRIEVDSLFVEPRMIGRYSAKSVDNRIDLAYLRSVAGQLRGIKLAFFHDGARRTVEIRANGVLIVSSPDPDDAEHFYQEMQQLTVAHALDRENGRQSGIETAISEAGND